MVRTKRSRVWAALAMAIVLLTALPVAAAEPGERAIERSWIDAIELLDVVWTWVLGGEGGDLDVLDLDVVPTKDGDTCEGTNPPQAPHPEYGCEVDPWG